MIEFQIKIPGMIMPKIARLHKTGSPEARRIVDVPQTVPGRIKIRLQQAGMSLLLVLAVCTAACTATGPGRGMPDARAQVLAAERAFAQTMADRDLDAFVTFVSEEAIFFSDPEPLRGRDRIRAGWAQYFTGSTAPFSWEPDAAEVLPSGTLALTSGPVRDPAGRVIARFNSIWRLESPGRWRVVFDKGSPAAAE
jgi:ketosteroid isomerase-like protein